MGNAGASSFSEFQPGGPSDFASHGEVSAAQAAANAYTDSVVASLAGVDGIAVSPQYHMDFNAAGGNLTTVAGSIVGVPETDWPEWSVLAYYYSQNGSVAVPGGWSTDGLQNLFFKLVSLSSGLQTIVGTVFVHLIGRP